MPTKMRLWYEGASYHVTSRGNNKINIFKETEDFEKYLSFIYEAIEYYNHCNYEIICYCLMTNHVHLMIKTGERQLGDFVGRINSKYTKYFNKKYECSGHLFQGRYFSDIVKDNTQIIETSRYIHLNPVKAKIVNKPSDYKWSSYNIITGKTYIEMSIDNNIKNKMDELNLELMDKLNLELELDIINPSIILNYFNEKNKYNSYINYVERKTPHFNE